MPIAQLMLAEFEQENGSTRKMIERVPDDKLDWRPHEKSMTLARLASHIADMPQWAETILDQDDLDFAGLDHKPWIAASSAELLEAFDRDAAAFRDLLKDRSDEHLLQRWKMRHGDHVIVDMSRAAAIRGFILSHRIHHRGQLSVYLRLLNVPLPQVYGPTADDSGDFGA